MNASDIEKKILESKADIVLLQDNSFKKIWDVIMIFLLLYVISYVPYATCFIQVDSDTFGAAQITDLIIDGFFFCDIIVQFISAYEDPVSGLPVVDMKKIAINYVKLWFFIDLVATIPV